MVSGATSARTTAARSAAAVRSPARTASMSATVVVPERSNISAPLCQEDSNSPRLQVPFSDTIDLIQSVKLLGGEIWPAMPV